MDLRITSKCEIFIISVKYANVTFWNKLVQKLNCITNNNGKKDEVHTVPAPLLGAASIQKKIFWPSDYHIKST